jgi:hypothetical protein
MELNETHRAVKVRTQKQGWELQVVQRKDLLHSTLHHSILLISISAAFSLNTLTPNM